MVSCLCEIENNKRGKQEFVDTLFENDELDQELIDLAEQSIFFFFFFPAFQYLFLLKMNLE